MPLLNYTTSIQASKTVSEIQIILVNHGAKSMLIDYDGDGHVCALAFKVETAYGELGIRLPIDIESVLKVMERQKIPNHFKNKAQAVRVAWRIVKNWVEAQMAILETEMVSLDQIMLPYIISDSGRTLYENFVDTKLRLKAGTE